MAKKQPAKKLSKGAKDIGLVDAAELRRIANELRGIARQLDEHAASFEELGIKPFDVPRGNLKNGISNVREWLGRHITNAVMMAGIRAGRVPTIRFANGDVGDDH